MLFNIIMEMIDFRSFDLNTKLLTTAPKPLRLIVADSSYTLRSVFSLTLSLPTKSLALTQLFARYFSQKASFL